MASHADFDGDVEYYRRRALDLNPPPVLRPMTALDVPLDVARKTYPWYSSEVVNGRRTKQEALQSYKDNLLLLSGNLAEPQTSKRRPATLKRNANTARVSDVLSCNSPAAPQTSMGKVPKAPSRINFPPG